MTSVSMSSFGVSPGLACSGTARTTQATITLIGPPTAYDFTLQCTLDNLQLVSNPQWAALSTTHYSCTTMGDAGITVTLLSPVAGLRLASSAATFAAGQSVILKKLESAW